MNMISRSARPPANADKEAKPWYRHGWVWFLFGIPATAIIAGSITLWIAVRTADSLVADDYYKEGRAINQRLEKDEAALKLGIRISPSIKATASGSQRIEVRFAANPGAESPQFIRLRLSHPTFNQMDVLATLEPLGPNRYGSEVPGIGAGRWYAQLEDDQSVWRIRATWTVE